jgi:hypothetical protein
MSTISSPSVELSSYRDQHFKASFTNPLRHNLTCVSGVQSRTGQTFAPHHDPIRWQFIVLHDRGATNRIILEMRRHSTSSDGTGQVQKNPLWILFRGVLQ